MQRLYKINNSKNSTTEMTNNNKKILDFLNELKNNNNREWFDQNRDKYQKTKKIAVEITETLIEKISLFDTSVKFENAQSCMFRINRDIRFSADKRPYKTNFGIFISQGGKKSGYAGYYLHFEPDNCFVAGGVYCPNNENLKKIRWYIYQNIDKFLEIIEEKNFKKVFQQITGDKLVNPPRGFDKNFSHIDLLKFKDYLVSKKISKKIILSDDFLTTILSYYQKMSIFNTFLNKALE